MIDKDFIREVFDTIIKQRWRSVMTAFGVFWGILILTLLIGAGMGLRNGLLTSFNSLPPNCVICVTSPTLLPYEGFDAGRKWHVTLSDFDRLRTVLGSQIKAVTIINMVNDGSPIEVRYADKTMDAPLAGEEPYSMTGFSQTVVQGRFINDIDIEHYRPVCVIGKEVAEKLFADESPLGKQILVDGKIFKVVGVADVVSSKLDFGFKISEGIVIPLSLMQKNYNQGENVHLSNIILHDDVDADHAITLIDPIIRKMHHLHPDDTSALLLLNMKEQVSQIKSVFGGIDFLIWIVGLGTLIAGLVGISNIMLISVKERTKEIGVRSAMGARPHSIVGQIMCESMLLTTLSGLVGLCLGVALLALLNNTLGDGNDSFAHPYMPFWTGVISLAVLILGGLMAGYMPARRALNIELVQALANE